MSRLRRVQPRNRWLFHQQSHETFPARQRPHSVSGPRVLIHDRRRRIVTTKHPTLGHTPLHSVQVTSDCLYISILPRAFLVCQETHLNSYDISTISSAVSKLNSSAISLLGDWYIVTDVLLECTASIYRVQAF